MRIRPHIFCLCYDTAETSHLEHYSNLMTVTEEGRLDGIRGVRGTQERERLRELFLKLDFQLRALKQDYDSKNQVLVSVRSFLEICFGERLILDT